MLVVQIPTVFDDRTVFNHLNTYLYAGTLWSVIRVSVNCIKIVFEQGKISLCFLISFFWSLSLPLLSFFLLFRSFLVVVRALTPKPVTLPLAFFFRGLTVTRSFLLRCRIHLKSLRLGTAAFFCQKKIWTKVTKEPKMWSNVEEWLYFTIRPLFRG